MIVMASLRGVVMLGILLNTCLGANDYPVPTKPHQTTCADKITDCKSYGTLACIGQYEPWARDNCAATCGYCSSSGKNIAPAKNCMDKMNDCDTYDNSACFGQYEPWARDNCAATCGYCKSPVTSTIAPPHVTSTVAPPHSHCADKLDDCHTFESYACVGQYEKWARENCAATCAYCTQHIEGCYYKGHNHAQNETWIDGCDYQCTCVDASVGFYRCMTLCVQWNLPKSCTLHPPKSGKCCPHPSCPPGYVIKYPTGYVDA